MTALLAVVAGVVAACLIFPEPTMWRILINALVIAAAADDCLPACRSAATCAVGGSIYPDGMSKVDAMQAMREARYARAANKTATVPKPAAAAPRRNSVDDTAGPDLATSTKPARADGAAPEMFGAAPVTEDAESEAPEALCGHRSMNNRLCRRPAGHSEKNHRYN